MSERFLALKVLNYFDKIVVEIKFLESSVFLKPGNFIYFVELNLAQNNIENIGIGLDGLTALKELNLSQNRIGNFKEVLNLNRLPNLTSCSFLDPHYGENPICSLCNY